MTGVDISSDAVHRLRERAAGAGVPVDARMGDMRELDVGPVDGAYSMGNSVGYFDPRGIRRFFAAVAPAVRPGGRFVVETYMAAESVLPHLEVETTHEAGGIRMSDRNRYDARHSRIDTTVTFEWDGERSSREMSHWVVTSGHLVRLLEDAGFEVEALHGGLEGEPFTPGVPRLLIVARRR